MKTQKIYMNFNTKFVIAKSNKKAVGGGDVIFQYKICYSKIMDKVAFISKVKKFQYKICYSKINII